MPTQTTQKNNGEKTRKAEWRRVKLGTLLEFKYGKGLPERNRVYGEFPVYGSGGVVGYHNEFLIKAPGIIIGRKGSIGEVYYSKENFFPIDTVFYVENSKEYDLRYSYYLLKSLDLKSLNSDAAVPGLNRNVAYDQMIEIPPLSEQKKIAEVLSAYDDLIEVNQKKIKTLETLAQTLYKEWFVKPVKDGLPNGWEVKKIGDRFVTVLGGTPSRAVDSYWQNGTISWINSGKINEFRVFDQSEFITEEAVNKSATKMMPKRTTLVAITGATLGQFSLTEIECCANQSVVGIYDKENIYNEYIYLKISEIIKDLVAKSTGSAQPHINKDDVNNTEIIIPDLQTIKEFNQIILPIFNDISNLVFQNQNLQKTRDILIPQLVGGRVEVR